MDAATYEIESRVEETHWWFVGRRKLLTRIIRGFGLPRDAAVLDIGTSTGTNLRMLGTLGFVGVRGMDVSDDAIRWCAEKNLGSVTKGDVCDIPFPDASFDLVLATDIVEHVDDDGRALWEIARVLKPSGRAIVTVPAFPSLWGLQDEVARHKRRYRRGELESKLLDAGFAIRKAFYFNYILMIPIWLARQCLKRFDAGIKSENEVGGAVVDPLLRALFFLDVALAERLKAPFGVSRLVVVGRAENPSAPPSH